MKEKVMKVVFLMTGLCIHSCGSTDLPLPFRKRSSGNPKDRIV